MASDVMPIVLSFNYKVDNTPAYKFNDTATFANP